MKNVWPGRRRKPIVALPEKRLWKKLLDVSAVGKEFFSRQGAKDAKRRGKGAGIWIPLHF